MLKKLSMILPIQIASNLVVYTPFSDTPMDRFKGDFLGYSIGDLANHLWMGVSENIGFI